MDAKRIAVAARKSIGTYCMTECHAYCCRKGYLPMTKSQATLLAGEREEELIKKDIITPITGRKLVLDFGALKDGCPALDKEFKCTKHKEKNRPIACKQFPIFIRSKNIIHVSKRCPAVKEGLLYPYLAKFKLIGYKLSYGLESADNDFLKGDFIKDK